MALSPSTEFMPSETRCNDMFMIGVGKHRRAGAWERRGTEARETSPAAAVERTVQAPSHLRLMTT